MAATLFQAGSDPRRSAALRSPRNGRPPTAATISRIVRTRFSVKAVETITDRVLVMAEAGDPTAQLAAAQLLSAVLLADAGKQTAPET